MQKFKTINPDDWDAMLVAGHVQESPFTDNMYGLCEMCGIEVQFRSHSPHGPRVCKVCPECAMAHVTADVAGGGDPQLVLTPETIDDLKKLGKLK